LQGYNQDSNFVANVIMFYHKLLHFTTNYLLTIHRIPINKGNKLKNCLKIA